VTFSYFKSLLAPFVPPSEPNVNQILEDTRALAQIWDLYGHILNEDKNSDMQR